MWPWSKLADDLGHERHKTMPDVALRMTVMMTMTMALEMKIPRSQKTSMASKRTIQAARTRGPPTPQLRRRRR